MSALAIFRYIALVFIEFIEVSLCGSLKSQNKSFELTLTLLTLVGVNSLIRFLHRDMIQANC